MIRHKGWNCFKAPCFLFWPAPIVLRAASIFFGSSGSWVSKKVKMEGFFLVETHGEKVGLRSFISRFPLRSRRTILRFGHLKDFPLAIRCVRVIVSPLSSNSGASLVFSVLV